MTFVDKLENSSESKNTLYLCHSLLHSDVNADLLCRSIPPQREIYTQIFCIYTSCIY